MSYAQGLISRGIVAVVMYEGISTGIIILTMRVKNILHLRLRLRDNIDGEANNNSAGRARITFCEQGVLLEHRILTITSVEIRHAQNETEALVSSYWQWTGKNGNHVMSWYSSTQD